MTVHIFVGPTLAGQDVLDILPGSVVHPPVAHGDLLRLDLVLGDVVVIVDGYYHQSAPVRHKEILALLAEGVVVVGCASMGALRAAELARYGMIGNGAVYRMYRDGVLEADDEVALAHGPAPDYRSFTVPLVVIRHAVSMALRSGILDHLEATSIVAVARVVHYTERSWRAMEHAAEATDSIAMALARLRKFVESDPETTDVKIADVLDTVRKIANGELPVGEHQVGSWVSDDWRNRFLDEWQAEFGIATIDGIEVGHSAIIRYQQLYRQDFPARWQRFVLGRIAGAGAAAGVAEGDVTRQALSTAARSGLGAASMTDARLRHWLTVREAAELSADDALVRVLVRSYQPPCPTRDLADDEPDLVRDESARRMVAEASVVNAEVASWGGKQTVDHLKLTPLCAHLAEVWRIDAADPAALLAAARDRGFASTGAAIDAARMFFLRKSFMSAAG